ncbi:MAG: hypothetical protein K9J72_09430 [Synechococcus sp. Tobar2m-G35]|jgi:hypothetical protein|nr:hypothetical protein [Synechococcus sp. Tobar2m-G35]
MARPLLSLVLPVLLAGPWAIPVQARGGGFAGGGFGARGGFAMPAPAFHGGPDWHPQYGPAVRPFDNDGVDRNVDLNRNLDINRPVDVDRNVTVDRNVNNAFYVRDANGWNRSWANGGYWGSRPWRTGWYGVGAPGWGGWSWWGGASTAWGLTALASTATIAGLVNAASASQNPVIVVPGATLQLDYSSVDAIGSSGASFSYSLGSGGWLNGAANCSQGLLNGQVPQTADQAQLLNAVCAVAYGSGG